MECRLREVPAQKWLPSAKCATQSESSERSQGLFPELVTSVDKTHQRVKTKKETGRSKVDSAESHPRDHQIFFSGAHDACRLYLVSLNLHQQSGDPFVTHIVKQKRLLVWQSDQEGGKRLLIRRVVPRRMRIVRIQTKFGHCDYKRSMGTADGIMHGRQYLFSKQCYTICPGCMTRSEWWKASLYFTNTTSIISESLKFC